jgi:hypothetical protein
VTFYVDSVEAGAYDANADDEECRTQKGECTLRAAIEQANITAATGAEVEIKVKPDFSGTIVMPDTVPDNPKLYYMDDKDPVLNVYYYFRIKQKMTINLDNRLHVRSASKDNPASAFWVGAAGVVLEKFTDIYSNSTSIVFSPASDNSKLSGGESFNSENNFAEQMIHIQPGADGITIENYKMGRFNSPGKHGMIRLARLDKDTYLPIKKLTISNTVFDNTPATAGSTACNANSAAGCAATAISSDGDVAIQNLVIEESLFNYIPKGLNAIDLGAITTTAITGRQPSSDWDIRENTFTRVFSGELNDQATIHLPEQRTLEGSNYIRGNILDNAGTTGQNHAIRWIGKYNTVSQTASNMYIEDNYFDGYEGQTIVLNATGTVTVRRNRYGQNSGSQSNTVLEETTGGGLGSDAPTLMMNYNNTANRRILTWYPTSALNVDCKLRVAVEGPSKADSGYNLASTPVTLDFYYTAKDTAELYLGSVENITKATTVTVPMMPDDPGFIRIQTQGTAPNQPESSQYSRVVPFGGPEKCEIPQLELKLRAWMGVDPNNADYDQIVNNANATEIPKNGSVPVDEPVWFTYTVKNIGWLTVRSVVVRDSYKTPVCVITKELSRLESWGCSRQLMR